MVRPPSERTKKPKAKVIPFPADPLESAAIAGLRYVRSEGPGIIRLRLGNRFRYVGPDGKSVRDRVVLGRIQSLVIPPAWTEVWICPNANGHLQAVGRDARGRKQYRYHVKYRQVRDETKFGRMLAFGTALPAIRRQVDLDLRAPGLPKKKVVAAAVRLLEATCMRIGNEEYARQNSSYGLTTLQDQHVDIRGNTIRFHFRGKSGQQQDIELTDARLARIVKSCRDIPGYELFQYLDESGAQSPIGSYDVNEYIRTVAGQDFTAKDFRTWGGTGMAALVFERLGRLSSESEAKKNVVEAVKRVSQHLGNRPATCRKYYIHPAVIQAYTDGSLFDALNSCAGEHKYEACVMHLVDKYVTALMGSGKQDLSKLLKQSLQRLHR